MNIIKTRGNTVSWTRAGIVAAALLAAVALGIEVWSWLFRP